MSIKYVCDRCGKEIMKDGRYEVRVGAKGSPTFYHPTDWGDKDLCLSCAHRIVRMTFEKVATVNQEFEDAVNEMVAESETVKTNFDRLKEMSVDELARQMAHGQCSLCAASFDDQEICDNYDCVMGISEWLEQEVSEE